MTDLQPALVEEETDPIEVARARARHERFDRNWAWLEEHAADVLDDGVFLVVGLFQQEGIVLDWLRGRCWVLGARCLGRCETRANQAPDT